ncbi:hypothetical protein BCR42DRAFT_420943 [Absidia repens]|uniref:DUF3020 domain-containing protein n=1 Tax=Absidia repens TaxID=90262 RepID=A0A1X2I901_9FUNG|nr:hypothetical protein BCR42DRAFT_420943 [Absidia repens]
MRKWRAANRDKNKRNDLRCRVYKLAREKFQDDECIEKELFIKEQISKRLGRQTRDKKRCWFSSPTSSPVSLSSFSSSSSSSSSFSSKSSSPLHYDHGYYDALPYQQPIVLPSLTSINEPSKHHSSAIPKIRLPPLQSSPSSAEQRAHSSALTPPLLLHPNPIYLTCPMIPMSLAWQ